MLDSTKAPEKDYYGLVLAMDDLHSLLHLFLLEELGGEGRGG